MSNHENVRNRLLAKFPAKESGTWEIRGEDHNCDLGGSHHMPSLGFYEGNYEDIVDLALDMSGFFAWGGGGDIRKTSITTVSPSTVREVRETKAELQEIEKRKEELEKRLNWLKLGGAA